MFSAESTEFDGESALVTVLTTALSDVCECCCVTFFDLSPRIAARSFQHYIRYVQFFQTFVGDVSVEKFYWQ